GRGVALATLVIGRRRVAALVVGRRGVGVELHAQAGVVAGGDLGEERGVGRGEGGQVLHGVSSWDGLGPAPGRLAEWCGVCPPPGARGRSRARRRRGGGGSVRSTA